MVYDIIDPNPDFPILVSVPHCGTQIPADLASNYLPERIAFIDDTDWYVDRLYSFVSELGISLITANISRWVIDLNRNPESKPLYNDGRVITALTPTSDFNGGPIYKGEGPNETEVQQRISTYFNPYYAKITKLLAHKRARFDHVLFFDAHSIRREVPGIRAEPFPDLILGDANGTTAHPSLIETASSVLSASNYSFQHNDPFMGGNLTRHFGKPANGVHALQLEMSKILYMDDTETNYDEARAAHVQAVLKPMFASLIDTLKQLNYQG